MPETTTAPPQTTTPTEGGATTGPKPKRKPRAKKPAAEKVKKERRPARTLAAWLREQGPHYVEAARVLGSEVRESIRHERARVAQVKAAYARVARLEVDLADARKVYDDLNKTTTTGAGYVSDLDRLDTLARQIAAAKGETVEIVTDGPNTGTPPADIDAAD